MHIIPLEQTARHFHESEIHSFDEIFPAELQTHIAQENFLHDSRNCYIKAGKDFWKYESRTRFVPATVSRTKYLDLCASTKTTHDAELLQIDDRLWIPIHRADGDNWEEIGTQICTLTKPPRLFPVMVRRNFWLFDTDEQRVYMYRRRFLRNNIAEQNYSGADIESIVKEAVKRLFVKKIQSGVEESQWKKLSQGDIESVIAETPSSYHSQKEKLDKMLEKLQKLDVKSAT